MIKNYILVGLVSILVVFGIIISIKCSKLEKENLQLETEQITVVDSIKIENECLKQDIMSLENQVLIYKSEIDSLKKVKQKVITKYKYVVSENLTEGVGNLKEKIRCERYY
jgi:hypothetical protein